MVDKIIVTNKANKDLKDVLDWYDNHSGEAGDRFLEELNIYVAKIAAFPSHYKMVTGDSAVFNENISLRYLFQ